ncbi:MAG: T9SS type A sorting domain-containing protein [Bacteroidetes bacterium]|nr:T9SS type A sorting domain-containing protein [Bacteroidota bacterium]
MKKQLLVFLFLLFLYSGARAQYHTQYFDGADTSAWSAIFVNLDTTGIWQVGPPQKIIFESASTIPNVLITDTVNTYPDSVSASAWFTIPPDLLSAGGLAIQWNQKLDLDTNKDGALVEFSTDSGATWENAFGNPSVYNFYGWSPANEGSIPSGELCFTGTDSTWKNVWLCFLYDFLWNVDNLSVRFRMVSDSIETNQEGWMIDNLMVAETWFHPVMEQSKPDNFKLYPTITDRTITLEQINLSPDFILNQVALLSMNGQFIRSIPVSSTLEVIDLADIAPGRYLLLIEANGKKELHEIVIAR